MEVKKVSRNVITAKFDDVKEGWEKWFLLSSDRHHDSRHSDRKLIKEHLVEVKKRDAHIIDIGDFFDAMQGKYDPRRSYPDMQSKYLLMMQKGSKGYLDVIVDDAINFYKDYADRFLLITKGNHETAIASHNDTDLTNRLVYGLNSATGSDVNAGMFGGWIKFQFVIQKTQRQSINFKYYHGVGGGGPVTKGTIQTARQAVYLPDADIVANGHIHENWVVPIARERFNQTSRIYHDNQYHVRTGTYKDEYGDGAEGWAIDKAGHPPKPLGAMWMRFYFHNKAVRVSFTPALG